MSTSYMQIKADKLFVYFLAVFLEGNCFKETLSICVSLLSQVSLYLTLSLLLSFPLSLSLTYSLSLSLPLSFSVSKCTITI